MTKITTKRQKFKSTVSYEETKKNRKLDEFEEEDE